LIFKQMSKFHKKIFLALVGVLVIAGGIYFWRQSPGQEQLPVDFVVARKEAALVSQKIVDLTSSANENIKAVNFSDFSGDPDKALAFIRNAKQANNEAANQAFELSRDLKDLTASLGEIKSSDRQRLALKALTVESGLLIEFMAYTQDLNNFLDNLARAIATDLPSDRDLVNNSLKDVNERVAKINSLNREFSVNMAVFDDVGK
jgi:hypothetical protein